MSDIWKMLFFSVAFATLLIGFVAVRQYSNGAARRACIANMKAINGAKATWSIKQKRASNDVYQYTNEVMPRRAGGVD